jgi:hypothetical protein
MTREINEFLNSSALCRLADPSAPLGMTDSELCPLPSNLISEI